MKFTATNLTLGIIGLGILIIVLRSIVEHLGKWFQANQIKGGLIVVTIVAVSFFIFKGDSTAEFLNCVRTNNIPACAFPIPHTQ